MRFVSNGIGDLVLKKLSSAIEVRLAVAYFNPDEAMLRALLAVEKLTVIISEEFTINDPTKLARLKTSSLLSVPTDHSKGRLHAKVLIARLLDGSQWMIVGSANYTRSAMFSNQEACVFIEPESAPDDAAAREIESWFAQLVKSAHKPDLAQAKAVYDARSRYRLVLRDKNKENKSGRNYWALKTTSGSEGSSRWPMFLKESVVAIGWSGIRGDPSRMSRTALKTAIGRAYAELSQRQAAVSANQIGKFLMLGDGDLVIICRGYTSAQRTDVHVYGVARIAGQFRAEHGGGREWRFKYPAVIQELEINLPKRVVATSLRKDSLRSPIHELSESSFERFVEVLRESGILLEV